jgi:hypothetical protein
LPDFSWYNIPKWGKYAILPQNLPNRHKIHISNGHKIGQISINIFQQLPIQDPPKFTQIVIFGLKYIQSGTPALLINEYVTLIRPVTM